MMDRHATAVLHGLALVVFFACSLPATAQPDTACAGSVDDRLVDPRSHGADRWIALCPWCADEISRISAAYRWVRDRSLFIGSIDAANASVVG